MYYIQTTCTVSKPEWSGHMYIFKTIGIKQLEELCTQGTHCSFIFIVKMPEKCSNCKKRSKFILRIISKPHAYLQSIMKTSVKFQKIRNKTVRGVAHTRYPLSIHFHCQNTRKTTKFKLQKSIKN